MIKPITISLIAIIILNSCRRDCTNSFISPAFIGFSNLDIDTFIVRKFEQDNTFTKLIDTIVVTKFVTNNPTFPGYLTSNDTTVIHPGLTSGNQFQYIVPGYDWQIYIPSINRTISISNITQLNNSEVCYAGGDLCPTCFNEIDSLKQNGQLIKPAINNFQTTYYNGYLVYINK